ncbi:hypothetical protein [Hyphococcus sp.]|uniref:hypothetical protein n=1 Tax=Hyphococcus sp. TaxID=2038636 RepID=UPI003D148A45
MKYAILLAASSMLAVACARDEAVENDPKAGEIVEEGAEDIEEGAARVGEEISAAAGEAADAAGDFIENELSQSNARGFTARNIIGESVRGEDKLAIAVIDDLLFTPDGMLRAVVLEDGAFLGLGGKPATVSADRFAFAIHGDGGVAVTVTMTDGELKQMTESLAYEPAAGLMENPGNLMSMSELLGASVVNENGDKVADMFDIILADPGRFDTAILSVGGLGAVGNRLVSVDISSLAIDRNYGAVRLLSAPDFDALPTFEY